MLNDEGESTKGKFTFSELIRSIKLAKLIMNAVSGETFLAPIPPIILYFGAILV